MTDNGGEVLKRILGVALLGLVIGACAAPAPAFGANNYSTYVGCSPSPTAVPSHTCTLGDEPGAFFESPEAEVEYEICVEFPDGAYVCREEEEAEEGVLYVNPITADLTGDYLVEWYVEGVEVGNWAFRIDAPPPPPVVVPASPPASVVSPPPGPTRACLLAKKRVKKLQAQLKAAKSAKAKKGLRKRLHGAKAAKKAAC
jgi:hypothetical protein